MFMHGHYRAINMGTQQVDVENIESPSAWTAFERVRCKSCLAPCLAVPRAYGLHHTWSCTLMAGVALL